MKKSLLLFVTMLASVAAWDADAAVTATSWAELSELFANASADADAPTEVILAADITAGAGDTYFTLSGNRHLVLDLNGHTIDRNMSEAASNGYTFYAKSNSSLTIRDSSPEHTGTITGGWGSANVGCIASYNATLRLEGGTITGNRVNSQGGSAVNFYGTFYMTGGTITGNIANTNNYANTACGAIYFSDSSHFYMSGGSITGNYCGATTDGSAGLGFYLGMGTKNVHLSGSYTLSGNMQGTYDATSGTWSNLQPSDYLNTDRCYIRIDDTIDTPSPMVMVLHNNYYTDFTRGWSTFMEGKDPENYFTLLPYITDRGIGVVNGEATIGSLHTITLGDNITASATSAAPGRPVTLGYTDLPEDYKAIYTVTIDGSDPAETVDVIDGTFVMPDADVTVSADLILDGIIIDEENFPDANFRSYLLSQSYGSDGVLTFTEIAGITYIDVAMKDVSDMTGIEHFTALEQLNCTSNQLTALDVSHNTALKALYCMNNQLAVLDVSQNTALEILDCYSNQLAALDVSHNTALKRLECQGNQLAALDVSQNTALETFYCYSNQLTALDVSHNTALKRLDCSNNQLTALDVSHNTALIRLDCSTNQLTALDVSHNTALTSLSCGGNQLTALDVSHSTSLTYLDCYGNQLTSLDVSQNTALNDIRCYDNQLTALDLSHNTALTYLDCSINQINGGNMEALVASLPTVDVDNNGENGGFVVIDLDSETEQNVITASQGATAIRKNWTVYSKTNDDWQEYYGSALPIDSVNFPDENFRNWLLEQYYGWDGVLTAGDIASITIIEVNNNEISSLTGIEHFTALEVLDCYENNLTALDVSHNTALKLLHCNENQLTSLDVSHNTALTELWCSGNQLTSLDLSHNTALWQIDCEGNQLDTLDVSHNTALRELWCSGNQLTSLDLSHNTALRHLYCYSNQLTALDVSHNIALSTLECQYNQLDTLDVSHNTALTKLECGSNQLTSLDVSHNTALSVIYCYSSQLTALDVSHNTALRELKCQNNHLTALDVSHNTALIHLDCRLNQLTALDVSHNTALIELNCSENRINGDSMEALVASLPTVDVDYNWGDNGEFRVINLDPGADQNVITATQVTTARGKNWTVYGWKNGGWHEYDGSEPTTQVPGDVNGDGAVTSADVTEIYNYLLSGDETYLDTADVNGDGSVTSADITAIYSIILGQ